MRAGLLAHLQLLGLSLHPGNSPKTTMRMQVCVYVGRGYGCFVCVPSTAAFGCRSRRDLLLDLQRALETASGQREQPSNDQCPVRKAVARRGSLPGITGSDKTH